MHHQEANSINHGNSQQLFTVNGRLQFIHVPVKKYTKEKRRKKKTTQKKQKQQQKKPTRNSSVSTSELCNYYSRQP